MSGHSGKNASTGSGGRRGIDRRRAAEEEDDGGRSPQSGRRKAIPTGDSARPHLSSRLAKAGLLGVVMALGATVAAYAAPGNNPPPAAADAAPTCALKVPDQPFTAAGLATPYRLVGLDGTKCNEGNPDTAAFVQGMVIDPATGALSVYDPLVIDNGTKPAVAPVVPALPANAVVALWFGFNGDTLTLQGAGASSCVTGLPDSPFGQFSYCGAPAFFDAAQQAIAAGKLAIPAVGTAADHQPCPTTRDFGIVDQDQSDNVTTTYLVLADGRTAQNTHAAAKALGGKSPQVLANGSDNLLLDHFVDPALNCVPFTAPNLADKGTEATALGLNELQAAAYQQAPVAIVPLNDPMVLDGSGATSEKKTDFYRAGVGQPMLAQVSGSPGDYCKQLRTIGVTRTEQDRALTNSEVSPDTGAATDLFSFLAMRLQQSYENLTCEKYINMPNPVHLKMNGDGLVDGATFDKVSATGPSATPSAGTGTSAAASPSQSPSKTATTPPPPASSPAAPVTSTSAPASTSKPAAPPVTHTTAAAPPASTAPPADYDSHSSPSPAAGAVTPAPPGGPDDSHPSTGAAAGASGGANPAQSPNAGAAAGGSAQPGTDVVPSPTDTPVLVAGFEHTSAAGGANNPRSALAGPDPMANTGFSLTSSRVLWGAAGAVVALCLSLFLRRRPRRR
ncbi:MAG TPA: hypothetical protein VFU73_08605 [Actinocrinis sp.]|nr:hypothetical protein [Actinocrinis sp.]